MRELEGIGSGEVVVLGHRGAMGHAPENTLVSFQRALSLGADLVELDVRLNKDNEVVVIHDAAVDRTTNGHGLVATLSTAELLGLDAGSPFGPEFPDVRIPLLSQVLEWASGRVELVIEIKGDPIPREGLVSRVLPLIDHYGMAQSVMIISFHHPTLRQIKDSRPDMPTGMLYGGFLADTVAAARAAGADSVRPAWQYWTPELVQEVHRAGLSASTWTVNDKSVMERVIAMGIDSVGTNYPDRLRLLVGARG